MPLSLSLHRVITFTHQFEAMRNFYRDTFGMRIVSEEDGWVELDSGGCRLAIHAAGKGVTVGPDHEGPHKLVFYADDVAAARADLLARGVAMGPVHEFGALRFCDGSDPDANRFQISNRG